ncbi:MAG: hypothetical protein O3A95_03245 [Planctomycetota bacterium]|nr:hypothetical protein [Planctomycetota bacterium]MDA1113296.1 hypothetical protein [Planctomycetota bacterium]
MRFPIPRGRVSRFSLFLTGLLIITAYLPMPLPIGLINRAIALRAPELALKAEGATIRWGFGQVIMADLRLTHKDLDRARVERLDAFLDLRPWSKAFGKPITLKIQEADGDMSLEVLESLAKLKSNNPEPFPLQLEIADSQLRWTDEEQRVYQVGNAQVKGYLSAQGSRFAVNSQASLPATGAFDFHLEATQGFAAWTVALAADVRVVEDWAVLAHPDLPWVGGHLSLRAEANGTAEGLGLAKLQGSLALAQLEYPPYDIRTSKLGMDFEGDNHTGIQFSLHGSEAHGDFAGGGAIRLTNGEQPEVGFAVRGEGLEVTEELVDWLDSILPDVGAIVKGLEPRGYPQTEFAAQWNEELGFDWSLHVDATDTALTYRGFLDEEDGSRISFPYPVNVQHGHMVTGNKTLLFLGETDAGETGNAWATGTFDFRPEEVEFALDLTAENVTLDAKINHALTGNPEIARLWRDLGSPSNGTAGIEVLLRYDGKDFGVGIRGEGTNLDAIPGLLPLPMHADSAWFSWTPGLARFGGLLRVMGGDFTLSGEAREAAQEGIDPVVRMTLQGQDAAATLAEMNTLSAYLQLPPEIADFPLQGDVSYGIQMVLPLNQSAPHMLTTFTCSNAKLDWPDMGLSFTPLNGQGAIALRGKEFLISLPRTWSGVDGGNIRASYNVSSQPGLSMATVYGQDLHIRSDLLLRMQELTGQEPWGTHADWSGTADIRATLNPDNPEEFQARVDLKPLTMQMGDALLGETFRLQGAIHLFPDGFKADVLRLFSEDSDLTIHEVDGVFEGDILNLNAILDSQQGISLSSRLALIANREALSALSEIGLDGHVRADNLRVEAILPAGGTPRIRAEGGLILEDVSMAGMSPITRGYAKVEVRKAWWSDSSEFGAELDLSDGTGMLGEVGMSKASAHIHIDSEVIRWTDVDLALLGGKVTTNGKTRDGEDVRGYFSLGLTKEAPIEVRCFAEDLSLQRMRREVGLSGSLAGQLGGYLYLKSPSPSPTFCKGLGQLRIENGVLGTVPVLNAIWRVAGIAPPKFSEGVLDFRVDGKGKIFVEKLALNHSLLEVRGEGSIDMDTNLSLKVTLRTFSLLGRLPILKDLIDFLVEQQVYGPAEAPIITQRAVSKIGGDIFARPPFPLWVPAPPKPDWKVSPVLPIE